MNPFFAVYYNRITNENQLGNTLYRNWRTQSAKIEGGALFGPGRHIDGKGLECNQGREARVILSDTSCSCTQVRRPRKVFPPRQQQLPARGGDLYGGKGCASARERGHTHARSRSHPSIPQKDTLIAVTSHLAAHWTVWYAANIKIHPARTHISDLWLTMSCRCSLIKTSACHETGNQIMRNAKQTFSC